MLATLHFDAGLIWHPEPNYCIEYTLNRRELLMTTAPGYTCDPGGNDFYTNRIPHINGVPVIGPQGKSRGSSAPTSKPRTSSNTTSMPGATVVKRTAGKPSGVGNNDKNKAK
jgi:hypothetical protein